MTVAVTTAAILQTTTLRSLLPHSFTLGCQNRRTWLARGQRGADRRMDTDTVGLRAVAQTEAPAPEEVAAVSAAVAVPVSVMFTASLLVEGE